jgi:hypothetical protein
MPQMKFAIQLSGVLSIRLGAGGGVAPAEGSWVTADVDLTFRSTRPADCS